VKTPIIRILDFGDGFEFESAVSVAASLIRSMAATYETEDDGGKSWRRLDAMAHVETVSSGSQRIFLGALTTPALVLHIASHVGVTEDQQSPAFSREDELLRVSDIADALHDFGSGISADCLIIDGCDSARTWFTRPLSDCLSQSIVYVGTTRAINNTDSAVFAAAFYGRLLRQRGGRRTANERTLDAATVASSAYETLLERKSPFQVQTLHPSRRALASFAG